MTSPNNKIIFCLVPILAFTLVYLLLVEHVSTPSSVGYMIHLVLKSIITPENATTKESSNPVKMNQTAKWMWNNLALNRPTDGPVSVHKETVMPILFKKNFKKLPTWNFEDIYIRDIQFRQTTCPQSLQSNEDSDFKEAFIPNVQLYMYREDLNMTEWNRLAHFNNPFGFMEYTYSEVKAAVDLISKPRTPLLHGRCVHCAVVANGGILNGSGMGKEIDAHDYVFRMNGAITQGYEKDVGNRTSVYVHTAYSITTSPLLFKKFGYKGAPGDENTKYVMIPEGMRDFEWLQGLLRRIQVPSGSFLGRRPWTYYAGQLDENRFYVLHPDFLRYVRNRFLKAKQLDGVHWAIFRPTNGAFALFLALHTCDVVDAYGFITEDHSKYPNYYFEKNAKSRVIFYLNHDYNLEIKTWKKLHDAKVIRLYQRKENAGKGTDKL